MVLKTAKDGTFGRASDIIGGKLLTHGASYFPEFGRVYKGIVKQCEEGSTVSIFVAADCDGICACRIFTVRWVGGA